MSRGAAGPNMAAWGGWTVAAALALTPLVAWLGPLGFAPLMSLAGLAALPGFRLRESDRPILLAVLVLVVWAMGSTLWSPYHPKSLGASTGVKMVGEAVLYASAVAAARNAPRAPRTGILRLLAWGIALLGLFMLSEALTGAAVYRALRDLTGDPIRPDLGIKNVAQGLFILALLAPAAILAGFRTGAGVWTAIPILVGLLWPSHVWGYDAPILALVLSAFGAALVWGVPRAGPVVLAALAALFFMCAPVVVWFARREGLFARIQERVSLSWSERMDYWAHAQDWIWAHPLRGWGLDASRMFGPGIKLHPHDAALQIWLELGLIGAVAATVFWTALLSGLQRPRRSASAAAGAGCALAYLTFNAVSFGVWQEWWLALGALACAACAALNPRSAAP